MRRRALIVLTVALLLGSAAAFTWTEKLKLERAPIGEPRFDHRFSPGCGCPRGMARLSFLLHKADRLHVVVVDEADQVVRTLAKDLERPSGRVEFQWDGKDAAGATVPDGDYRLRVALEGAERTIVTRARVRVDTKPPDVRLLSVSALTLVPGGEGIRFRYAASESGRPILLVDGRIASRKRARRSGPATLTWTGTIRSNTVAPGRHQVAVVVADRAGNRSRPTEAVTILVRPSATG